MSAALEFIWRQSYGKSFEPEFAKRAPSAVPGLAPEPPIPLRAGLTARLDGVRYPAVASGADRVPTGVDVQTVLCAALGILRREPSNTYNNHRAFPAPRCHYTTHAYVVGRGDSGSSVVYYDPAAHALRPVEGYDPGAETAGALASAEEPAPCSIALVAAYGDVPAYYRDLRYSLALLELGHALSNVVLVATALGLRVDTRLIFADAAVLRALRLPESGGWTVGAIVGLGRPAWCGEPMAADAGTRRTEPATVASGDEGLAQFDRSCWSTGACTTRRDTAFYQVPGGIDPPSAMSVARVLFERNSGRGHEGIAGAVTAVPAEVVLRACRRTFGSFDCDVMPVGAWSLTGLRVLFALERVTGLKDGVYELFPDRDRLALIDAGPRLERVERAFSSRGVRIRTLNMAGFFIMDSRTLLEAHGPRGFRFALIEMGALAQRFGCALAAEGLFARPCRSFREPQLDQLLRLGAHESVGYELLCGVNRFHDLVFDLRC